MEKVFLVIEEWNCDGEAGFNVTPYNSPEDARDAFENIKASAAIDGVEWNYDKIEEDDTSYAIYLDGNYNNDHISVKLEEKEII